MDSFGFAVVDEHFVALSGTSSRSASKTQLWHSAWLDLPHWWRLVQELLLSLKPGQIGRRISAE